MLGRGMISVLVLDNNPAVRAALVSMDLGGQVHLHCADAEEPGEWAQQAYAAVVADDALFYGRREEPLIEFIKREIECPIIYLTVSSSRRAESMAKEAGVAVVLRKPFGAGDFRRALGHVLHREIIAGVTGSAGERSGAALNDNGNGDRHQEISSIAEHVAPDSVFDQLFHELERRQPLQEDLDAFDVVEKQLIQRALEACHGNQSQAARFLGITRNTLRKRIQKYGFAALTARDEQPGE